VFILLPNLLLRGLRRHERANYSTPASYTPMICVHQTFHALPS